MSAKGIRRVIKRTVTRIRVGLHRPKGRWNLKARRGYTQFTKIFDGKKFKYYCFIPDKEHQGSPGYLEELKEKARKGKYFMRTIRTNGGWEVYYRGY